MQGYLIDPKFTIDFIGRREKVDAYSSDQVWDFIGQRPLGACYTVYFYGTTRIAEEFVPF